MLHRLLASIIKEMLSVWRDPRSRQMVTLAPLMQVLIFTFAATLEVSNVDLVVINEDSGHWSQELIHRISAAGFVGSLTYTSDMSDLGRRIENGEALAGVRFPSDFSRNIAAGNVGRVQIIFDGRHANSGQITFSYLSAISADLGIELRQRALSATGVPIPAMPRAAVRQWYNPNLEYRWFIVPSLGATLAMMIALMLTTLSIARERELGTYDQLLVSPTTAMEIIASKTIPAMLFGFVLSCTVTLIAIYLFRIPFVGSALLMLTGLVCFLFSAAGIGLTVSSLCQTQQQAMMGLFFCMVPLMLISGFITPVENMPHWLQHLAQLSPLTHYLIIIQGSFLKAMTLREMLDNIWPLALIGGITCTIATVVVRARME
jgi:ABC-2 type transport system permease protein